MKKYELVKEWWTFVDGKKLFRIKALIDIEGTDVKKDDMGGFIESEANLSHSGSCWVYDRAKVYGNASVSDNAKVFDRAKVSGCAWVYGDAWVFGNANISGDGAEVYGRVKVSGYSRFMEKLPFLQNGVEKHILRNVMEKLPFLQNGVEKHILRNVMEKLINGVKNILGY